MEIEFARMVEVQCVPDLYLGGPVHSQIVQIFGFDPNFFIGCWGYKYTLN
jgi:hypothetical protein